MQIWLDDWEACTQDKITSMTPDALSAILTALVVLREGQSWLPSGRWLDAYMAAAQPSLPAFRGADLREMLNGLTGLGCDPEPEWMESFKGALSARAVAMDPSDLGAVLFALTKMKVQFP